MTTTKTARALVPAGIALVVGAALAVMPAAPCQAVVPQPELRPMVRPLELRAPRKLR